MGPTHRLIPRAALRLAVLLASLSAACLTGVPSAQGVPAAAPPGGPANAGCQTVHAGPQIAPGRPRSSYFQLSVRAGSTREEAVLIANPEPYPCAVTLDAASGQTAVNSGDTYLVPSGRCHETSCWITGLPASVIVPAHGRVDVPFHIAVPAGAVSGEYLAGVVARPTLPPTPAPTSSTQVAIAVTSRVAIGVAVTIPGPLHPLLVIPAVALEGTGAAARLSVAVTDTGNTWEHPAGGALIRVKGQRRKLGIQANTILPGDSARLPLTLDGVPQGTWITEVVLYYGPGDHLKATWTGPITYPASIRSTSGTTSGSGRSGPGAASAGPAAGAAELPRWIFAVIGGLVGAVALLSAFLILLFLRRRTGNRRSQGRHALRAWPSVEETSPVLEAR